MYMYEHYILCCLRLGVTRYTMTDVLIIIIYVFYSVNSSLSNDVLLIVELLMASITYNQPQQQLLPKDKRSKYVYVY